jgi:serine/threonine protein kinase
MDSQAQPPPTFQPELFGKYFLIDRVATGGMAEIFKAKTYSTAGFEKLQVIKRILAHLSDNEDFVSMFIDEAKISVSLQHANLVQIYDFGKIRDNYYIAMELVEGKDVKQILRKLAQKRKLLPEEFAIFIAHEVCKGLDYAHKKTNLQGEPLGIIHRDMSPSNVLVSYSGEVKIADFGIAKAEMSTYNTKDGVLKGKFEYMSPEQARGEDVTQQSDIFSVGIILYEMLTGRRLFKTENEIKTLEKIKAVSIRPPSSMNPNIPQRLDELVMKALSKDLTSRYADARELQQDLLEYMYPSTPTAIQRSLALFMDQLFADDIMGERGRLEEGSKITKALYLQQQEREATRPPPPAPGEWEEGPSSSASLNPPPRRWPLFAMTALSLALFMGLGFAIWKLMQPPPEPQVIEVKVSPTTGALVLRTQVPARFYYDGQLLGEGKTVVERGDLSPGEHKLRIEADGHEPYEEPVTVAAGEKLIIPIKLTPIAAVAPGQDDSTPRAYASIVFVSTPPGATVSVEGREIGKTPTTWDKAIVGRDYRVRARLSGFKEDNFKVEAPDQAGESRIYDRKLVADSGAAPSGGTTAPTAAAPGKVSVSLAASNRWGEVYIDGKKVGTTPLFNYALPAGPHKIEVKNAEIGLDKSETVTIVGNETKRVIITLD